MYKRRRKRSDFVSIDQLIGFLTGASEHGDRAKQCSAASVSCVGRHSEEGVVDEADRSEAESESENCKEHPVLSHLCSRQ